MMRKNFGIGWHDQVIARYKIWPLGWGALFRTSTSADRSAGIALHRDWRSIKKLPRCRTVEMPDPCSGKSGRLEVHRVYGDRRIAAFLPIRIVGYAPTFLAPIIGANLPVP
jgi:hypothetical protein